MIASWLAGLDSVCQILLIAVIIAGIACWVAFKQLRSLSKTSRENFLFNLDKKYDDIYSGRKAVHTLEVNIKNKMAAEHSEGEDKLISEITSQMKIWEEVDADEYSEIKKVLDFCEFLGYLTVSKYLHPKEVKALYGPAFLEWGKLFKPYIEQRQKREGEEVYKYFMLAYKKLSGYKSNSQIHPLHKTNRSFQD